MLESISLLMRFELAPTSFVAVAAFLASQSFVLGDNVS
jgi:hypothetical protein